MSDEQPPRRFWHFDTWDLKHRILGGLAVIALAGILGWIGTLIFGADEPTDDPTTTTTTRELPTTTETTAVPADSEVDRDPTEGVAVIRQEDSEEFFDGAVLVSLGAVEIVDGTYEIQTLTIRVGTECWRLVDLRTGDAARVSADPQYEVQLRSVEYPYGSFAVFRQDQSAVTSLEPNC